MRNSNAQHSEAFLRRGWAFRGVTLGGFALLLALHSLLAAQCNGDTALCGRRFDQVCFLYTHNAYNVRGKHCKPNQNLNVDAQLNLGVRGMMLDVYWRRGRARVYHKSRLLGARPLQEDLAMIKAFLDQHPREVVGIIVESYVTPAQLDAELRQAGLHAYLHAQAPSTPWPTLGDMVAQGNRLVVFSEKDKGNPYPWLHHLWDYATENRWANHSVEDFDVEYHRGDSTNGVYLLNHFVTHRTWGYGLPRMATLANQPQAILDHALEAWRTTGHFPNFVAVDFVETGAAKQAVDRLNALWQPASP